MKWILIAVLVVVVISTIPSTEYYIKAPEVINPFVTAKAEFDRTGLISTSTARLAIYYIFGSMGPTFEAIATCESGLMHYKEPRVLTRNPVTADSGVLQLNWDAHGATIKKLGFKIYNLKDNLMYGKWLFDRYGLSPWDSSKSCWIKKVNQLVGQSVNK